MTTRDDAKRRLHLPLTTGLGRKSAALEDFRYSNPMKRANLVWDEDNLRAYIHDPQAKIKGNRMPYGGMSDAKDVDDVVAYLKTLK